MMYLFSLRLRRYSHWQVIDGHWKVIGHHIMMKTNSGLAAYCSTITIMELVTQTA